MNRVDLLLFLVSKTFLFTNNKMITIPYFTRSPPPMLSITNVFYIVPSFSFHNESREQKPHHNPCLSYRGWRHKNQQGAILAAILFPWAFQQWGSVQLWTEICWDSGTDSQTLNCNRVFESRYHGVSSSFIHIIEFGVIPCILMFLCKKLLNFTEF